MLLSLKVGLSTGVLGIYSLNLPANSCRELIILYGYNKKNYSVMDPSLAGQLNFLTFLTFFEFF